ncbi:MAG: hypothetical protein HQL18_00300 [Candidatus Omnitrophica bacterium]|nr:hypothetical protein [Candidatus Omnitrophota bacterium]
MAIRKALDIVDTPIKILLIACGAFVLFLGFVFMCAKYTSEGQILSVASIVAEMPPELSAGKKNNPGFEKEYARNERLLVQQIRKLRAIVRRDPKSQWADDAQFLITVFNVDSPAGERIKDLELLIENYPHATLEASTKKHFASFFSEHRAEHVASDAREDLCQLYRDTNETVKYQHTCKY